MSLKILKRDCLKQTTHVHGQQISTMPASDSYNVEQIVAWNTNREDGIAEVAVDIANMLGGDLC